MVEGWQPELVAVPTPTAEQPGRCRIPTRYGADRPCRGPAEGLAVEWSAPLDPAQRLGSCRRCADTYGLDLLPFSSLRPT